MTDVRRFSVNCLSCGKPFQSRYRTTKACSQRCRDRLRGSTLSDYQDASIRACSASIYTPGQASQRVYCLYRGRLDRLEEFGVDRYGGIASGVYAGCRLRDILQTATREGWLAYRRRLDGWYSAEWADGRIVLCGPVKSLPGTAQALTLESPQPPAFTAPCAPPAQ
jgi:hypothetical protein